MIKLKINILYSHGSDARFSKINYSSCKTTGVHIGPNDIPERFQIEDRELKTTEMCDLAQTFDLKAKATKISEKELVKLLSKKQQILRLKNGRYIIALRVIQGEKEDDKSVLCV